MFEEINSIVDKFFKSVDKTVEKLKNREKDETNKNDQ